MASAKIILKSSKVYDNGTSPIMIQITVNRRQYTKSIKAIPANKFDKKKKRVKPGYPLAPLINTLIERTLYDAQSYILECEINKIPIDPLSYFKGPKDLSLVNLFQGKEDQAAKENRHRTAERWRTTKNKIIDFDNDISVNHIDITWIKRFDSFLKNKYKNSPNTRGRNLKDIRHFAPGPFKNYKPPSNIVIKVKLTLEEVAKIESHKFDNKRLQFAADLFLFSIYNRGMRVSDVFLLKNVDIKNGFIDMITQKSKKHHKIKMSPKALAIYDKYKSDNKFLFPVIKKREGNTKIFMEHISSNNAQLGRKLKLVAKTVGIDKNISMHTARHTFSYICDIKGISLKDIQSLLGHSNRDTTETYIRELRKFEDLDNSVEGLF